jgi:hypothetical protein
MTPGKLRVKKEGREIENRERRAEGKFLLKGAEIHGSAWVAAEVWHFR